MIAAPFGAIAPVASLTAVNIRTAIHGL